MCLLGCAGSNLNSPFVKTIMRRGFHSFTHTFIPLLSWYSQRTFHRFCVQCVLKQFSASSINNELAAIEPRRTPHPPTFLPFAGAAPFPGLPGSA